MNDTTISYRNDMRPDVDLLIDLYRKAGLPRPTGDRERMQEMIERSDLIISAWHEQRLVGVARSITDWRWSCYLADLAVDPGLQKGGIGKELVRRTKEEVGDECMVLLLSVPSAMLYYPRIGMEKVENGFILQRKV